MLSRILHPLGALAARVRTGRRWSKKTLVVGPFEPVDGDSVACTKALISFLRRHDLEAYTLPTLSMYPQLQWILSTDDLHPCLRNDVAADLTTTDLQSAYDRLLSQWRPDEIVVVDGQADRIGFDSRGVPVYTIDHHLVNGEKREKKAYVQPAPSAGCLLIDRFRIYEPILAVSILTDTFWLRQNQPATAAHHLNKLTKHGLTDTLLIEYQQKLMVRKNPEIIAALNAAEIRFFADGEGVLAVLKDDRPEIHRGVTGELGYFARHIMVVRGDGYTSMRTDNQNANLRKRLEGYPNSGGHNTFAAVKLPDTKPETIDGLFQDFAEAVKSSPMSS